LKVDDGELPDRYGRSGAGSLQSAGLRVRDVRLPISVAFADSCYAFWKCLITCVVENDLQVGSDDKADNLSEATRVDPLIALRYE
jgi:hypothetical protein